MFGYVVQHIVEFHRLIYVLTLTGSGCDSLNLIKNHFYLSVLLLSSIYASSKLIFLL